MGSPRGLRFGAGPEIEEGKSAKGGGGKSAWYSGDMICVKLPCHALDVMIVSMILFSFSINCHNYDLT